MHSLFRGFSARRVRFLVIGGQASILYGASHFSQDLDLWVDPSVANVRRLVAALEALRARVHKLTPPLSQRYLRRGHGFHFIVPQPDGDLYLDIMGRPPRSGPFEGAWNRANRMTTPWGRLAVVSIRDLVQLKKTNRPGDYDVITRLAMIAAGRDPRPRRPLLAWAMANIFRAEDLWELVRRFPVAMKAPPAFARPFFAALRHGGSPASRDVEAVALALAERAQKLQSVGRQYWLPRIDELRRLRAQGRLLTEGTRVTRSLLP